MDPQITKRDPGKVMRYQREESDGQVILENICDNNVLLQVGFGSSISDSNDQSGIIVTRKTLPIKIRVLKYIKTRKTMKHTLLYVRPQMIPTRLHMSQTVRGCV